MNKLYKKIYIYYKLYIFLYNFTTDYNVEFVQSTKETLKSPLLENPFK